MFGTSFGSVATAYRGSIFNNGIINTGNGDDTVDGITGGFDGFGVMNLGAGNDTLRGFGTGTFNGGAGNRDKIFLGEGEYTITKEGAVTTIASNGVAMTVTGFEFISGIGGGETSVADKFSVTPAVFWVGEDGELTQPSFLVDSFG